MGLFAACLLSRGCTTASGGEAHRGHRHPTKRANASPASPKLAIDILRLLATWVVVDQHRGQPFPFKWPLCYMTGADTERLQDVFIVVTVRLISVHSLSVQSFSMKVLRKVAVQASVQIAFTHLASFFVRPASLLYCGQKHLFDEQPRIAYAGWLKWILAAVTMRDFGNPDSQGIEMLWPVYPNDDFPNQTWPTSTWFACLEYSALLVSRSRDCNRNYSTTPSSGRHTRLFSVDVHGSRPSATGMWSPRLLSLVLVLSAPFCYGSPLCLPCPFAVLWTFGLSPTPVHAFRHCCHRSCPSAGHGHRGPSKLERFRFRRISLQATLALHGCRLTLSSFSAGVHIPRHQATQASRRLGLLLGQLEFLRAGLSSLGSDVL